jgi:uncharacterized protein (TIGR04255 family)
MLGQVQFPPILRLQKGIGEVADLQDAIRELMPGFAVEQQIQVAVSLQGDAKSSSTNTYRFINEHETWSALLSQTSFTIEAVAGGRYSSYDDFRRLFEQIWPSVVAHLRPTRVTQQGLRYVDHLEGERTPAEWAEWINPSLFGGLATEQLSPDLEQAVTEMTYTYGDGRIVVRHGIAPAGPKKAKGYLVDADSIHTRPLEPQDVTGMLARFDESHDAVYRLFRWCMSDHAMEAFRHAAD